MARLGYLNLSLIALAVICALLFTRGAIQLATAEAPPARSLGESALQVETVLADSERLVLEQLQERPLFWDSRRAYVPPPPPPEPKPQPAAVKKPDPAQTVFKDTRLLGIYAGGQKPGAIFEHKGERIRLNRQESIEGWQLVALGPSWVEFSSDGQSFKLEIKYPSVDFTQPPLTD